MTRFLKVSLSVVALLLVSLIVFTGCGSKEAGEALTAAEEAMQAVTEATADFEAALADKADASKLADEVEDLLKAIEEAELVAADSDAALKMAIAAARAALTENTQAVVKALDVKIAQLLAEKADSEVLDAELARFEKILNNINNATGAYLKLNDFVSFSSQAGACAYELEQTFNRMAELKSLYGDNWAKIEKAYTIAKVTIYRATSMAVIDAAIAQFEKVVSENPTDIDDFYYNDFAKYENGTAKELYGKAMELYDRVSTDAEKAAVADYYGKGNLVLASLELWRKELTAEMVAIGKLYVVGDDATRINNAEAERAAFEAAVNACNTTFGANSAESLEIPETYTDNVARLEVMANAGNAAAAVLALNTPCDTELDQANVNAISAWKEAYEAWVEVYLPELQAHQKNDPACAARYNAVKALIEPTEDDLKAAVAALKALAKNYIDSANKAFIDDMKANFYTDSALDLTRVNILSGATIDAIANAAEAWATENDETLVLPAFLYADANAVKACDAYDKIEDIKKDYEEKLENFTTNVYEPGNAAIHAPRLNMYDLAAKNIIDAFEGLSWGNVESIALYDNSATFTKEEYDRLVALEAERLGFVATAKAHNDKITAAYNNLMAADSMETFANAREIFEDCYYPYFDGMYVGEELRMFCAYNGAPENEEFNDANGLKPTVPGDFEHEILLREKYFAVKHSYDIFVELDSEDTISDLAYYNSVKDGLQILLNEYIAIGGHNEGFATEVQNRIDTAI